MMIPRVIWLCFPAPIFQKAQQSRQSPWSCAVHARARLCNQHLIFANWVCIFAVIYMFIDDASLD